MNPKAKESLAAWREANKGTPVERLDPIEKAKRNPKSKVLAIKAFCWDCVGGSREEVKLCPCTKCPLWIHRPWQGKTQEDSEEEDIG
jgi:hypothetical protein